MGKKLIVNDGIFTITDTVSDLLEFRSLAIETYLDQLGSGYYFYYDTFISGDNIKKSRSVDYPYTLYQDQNNNNFDSVADLEKWASDNLGSATNATSNYIITGYMAEFDFPSKYIYSGYYKDGVPFIIRAKSSIVTTAVGITDLAVDWDNRLLFTYI